MSLEPDKWVTIQHACELATVSRRTIYNWIASNRVEWVRVAGGGRRIRRASLFKPGNVDGPATATA